MELMINELSCNGQFPDFRTFSEAIDRLMLMRSICRKFGRELYCHRNMTHAQVTRELNMHQVVQRFDMDRKRALMQWFTRQGPFWEDIREHDPDDYIECKDEVVTDTAIGEVAFRCFKGNDSQIVSMTPSNWEYSPLQIYWERTNEDSLEIDVLNHFDTGSLEKNLRSSAGLIESWNQLASMCKNRFVAITFSTDAFEPLFGYPFSPGVAQRIIERLEVLEKLKNFVDSSGNRTPEGHRLYQEHFTGDKAWFSDSSETEKRDFKSELTFKHPRIDGSTLFCTMHGKIKTPQTRIHFTLPTQTDPELYVVYIGPKITKK
ncbi:hypothetical protein [Nitrosomonas sp.]|uniref:hypothetical protein n=1 Tax=Nitrosomonas sp. TaxID=42353 RepID=UPI002631CAB1|nr:hypothetical protein [Nitrosomonas sp.]MCW5600016.1 hypothetical protein [Nitrosomonas sp.]